MAIEELCYDSKGKEISFTSVRDSWQSSLPIYFTLGQLVTLLKRDDRRLGRTALTERLVRHPEIPLKVFEHTPYFMVDQNSLPFLQATAEPAHDARWGEDTIAHITVPQAPKRGIALLQRQSEPTLFFYEKGGIAICVVDKKCEREKKNVWGLLYTMLSERSGGIGYKRTYFEYGQDPYIIAITQVNDSFFISHMKRYLHIVQVSTKHPMKHICEDAIDLLADQRAGFLPRGTQSGSLSDDPLCSKILSYYQSPSKQVGKEKF